VTAPSLAARSVPICRRTTQCICRLHKSTQQPCYALLAVRLNAEHGGSEAAARLVAEMGPKAADARALAYRLYEIASQKGWATEALIYNDLAQEWPKLEDLASTADVRSATSNVQASLF
jgi:putative DNA methylase